MSTTLALFANSKFYGSKPSMYMEQEIKQEAQMSNEKGSLYVSMIDYKD